VAAWPSDPVAINAVTVQNDKHASLSDADTDKMDGEWRAKKKAGGGVNVEKIQ